MLNGFFLLLLILLMSCAVKSPAPASEGMAQLEETSFVVNEQEDFFLNFRPLEINIRPGEVTSFMLDIPKEFEGELKCRDQTVSTFYRDSYIVLLSESYFSKLKSYECHWDSRQGNFLVAKIRPQKKDFPSETLKVDKRRVTLKKEDLKIVLAERKFKKVVYAKGIKKPLFTEEFQLPIHSKVTSIYGSKRIFNNKKQTQHLGTDYRAAVGTPIRSANSGKVVIARDLFYSGNTVVIDHGIGIYTIYGHLSRIGVSEGDYIHRGITLGLAGATGRVTGPHLHWGVKVNGLAVEGSSLVKASKSLFSYSEN